MAGMEVDNGSSARVGNKRNFNRSANNSGGGAGGRNHTQQVCRYWQEGRCLKGDDCQWLHPGNVGTTGRGSSGAGNGKRANTVVDNRDSWDRDIRENRDYHSGGGGGFSTGSNQGRSRNVSARWGKGRGSNRGGQRETRVSEGGAGVHRPAKQKPCSYWLKGTCTRGDTCNFLHAHTTAPDVEMTTQLIGHDKVQCHFLRREVVRILGRSSSLQLLRRVLRKAIRAILMPEGLSQLYTGSQDETVRVWDCSTGQCVNVVPMGGDVGAMLGAPGWLFVGLPNEVQAWNMGTSAQQSLSGPKGQVHALAISNEEGLLFAGTQDGSILLWKFNTTSNQFEPAASFTGHTGPVITLLFVGNRLYSGSMDNTIRVWELATVQCIQILEGHTDVVMDLLCWEQFLISCSLDGTIKVWAANTAGQLEMTFSHPEEESPADSRNTGLAGALKMCGCPDRAGKPVLLCSYNDNTVRLYDLPAFTERGQLFSREEVRALQVGPSHLLFTGDTHGTVKVWHWSEPQVEAVVE